MMEIRLWHGSEPCCFGGLPADCITRFGLKKREITAAGAVASVDHATTAISTVSVKEHAWRRPKGC